MIMHTGIIFTTEPEDIRVNCGTAKNAEFPCKYEGSRTHPLWIINNTEYSSINSQLPPDHYYGDNMLTVKNLLAKNGTQYQCYLPVFEDGVLCAYISAPGQLIVNCRGNFVGSIITTNSCSNTFFCVVY